jgi:adenylate cyclase
VAFASGELRLDGQGAVATVLMTDIRGFTQLSEREDPATILRWLNQYFGQLVPLVTLHGGVVNKFDGDAMLAFFGLLPRPLEPAVSAYQGCKCAAALLTAIEQLNARRAARGEPPLDTGIGVHTGAVTSGGLGAPERLHYTIIGDAVNTTHRMGRLARKFAPTSAIVSESTRLALGRQSKGFCFEDLGAHTIEGRTENLVIYRLLGDEAPTGGVEADSQ